MCLKIKLGLGPYCVLLFPKRKSISALSYKVFFYYKIVYTPCFTRDSFCICICNNDIARKNIQTFRADQINFILFVVLIIRETYKKEKRDFLINKILHHFKNCLNLFQNLCEANLKLVFFIFPKQSKILLL